MIHIYYGDGKGKTSAAVGMAVRAAGAGLRVLFVQFLKTERSNERAVLSKIENITLTPCPHQLAFTFAMDKEEFKKASTYYQALYKNAVSKENQMQYDMLVLDEVFSLCDCGMLKEETLLSFLQTYNGHTELVLTGHTVPQPCIALCDYASQIKKIRHPFDQGAAARNGIEF